MRPFAITSLLVLCLGVFSAALAQPEDGTTLPAARRTGSVSLEEALQRRASLRTLRTDPLSREQIAQLLWAAQGTNRPGRRTAPSAGALYPLELYVVTARGVSRYDPTGHRLLPHREGDRRAALYGAALNQDPLREAPAVFVIAGVYERTQRKYGARAARYVHMEVGHAGQNLLLQAAAMGLACVPIGAFDDGRVHRVLELPGRHQPLYLIPVGYPR
ncbi:MAG: SagB/ThcOx family dehydrogenase [Planctomycetota bacterium]|jgi:SagB-type dehydrogenase family enzyme